MFSKELSKRLVEMGVTWLTKYFWFSDGQVYSENDHNTHRMHPEIPVLTLEVALSREFLEQLVADRHKSDTSIPNIGLLQVAQDIACSYVYSDYEGAEKVLWSILQK